ncbi:MAG: nicotinate-nucleotide--dimethylbenzimidazole phosphoribosyltransferase [Methyloligellaceae bacterium]
MDSSAIDCTSPGEIRFESGPAFETALTSAPNADEAARSAARARQDQLTKPPGALGRLEDLAVWLAGWQGTVEPRVAHVQAVVFAGNHGVTAQGVSPYPVEVTAQMVANFQAGGAAINAMAEAFGYRLTVVPLDLDRPTRDFTTGPAMSEAETLHALNAGAAALTHDGDVIVLGEMGIGNTTVASALAAAVFGGAGRDWAGPGTGLDAHGVSRKADVIDAALALHRDHCHGPFETLRRLGGRELAAIAGAVTAARLRRIPVVLDGAVATAAVALLCGANSQALAHCVAGHVSAEPAHRRLLDLIGLRPLLDLEMRLGEGTGAAMAVQILKAAAATHANMATFTEADVSGRDD